MYILLNTVKSQASGNVSDSSIADILIKGKKDIVHFQIVIFFKH